MKKIAITGNIGSGKSSVAKVIASAGFSVIDTDQIAHELLETGTETWKQIVANFSEEILSSNDQIDRRRLAHLIFSDQEKQNQLESILHPAIKKNVATTCKSLQEAGKSFCFVEVPLLFETDWQDDFDEVVVIICDENIALHRAMKRLHLTEAEAKKRLAQQMSQTEKIKLADFIIDNSGNPEETKIQIEQLLQRLN